MVSLISVILVLYLPHSYSLLIEKPDLELPPVGGSQRELNLQVKKDAGASSTTPQQLSVRQEIETWLEDINLSISDDNLQESITDKITSIYNKSREFTPVLGIFPTWIKADIDTFKKELEPLIEKFSDDPQRLNSILSVLDSDKFWNPFLIIKNFLSPLAKGNFTTEEIQRILEAEDVMDDVYSVCLAYKYVDRKPVSLTEFISSMKQNGKTVEEALEEYRKIKETIIGAENVGKRRKDVWYKQMLPQIVDNYVEFITEEIKNGKDLDTVYEEVNKLLQHGYLWPNRFSWELWEKVIIPNWEEWQQLQRNNNSQPLTYPDQEVAFLIYSGYDHNAAFTHKDNEKMVTEFHNNEVFVVCSPEIFTYDEFLQFLSQGINPENEFYPTYIILNGHGSPEKIAGYEESTGSSSGRDSGPIVGYLTIEDISNSLSQYFDRLVKKGGYVIFDSCLTGDSSMEEDYLSKAFAEAFGSGITIIAPVDSFKEIEIKFENNGLNVTYYFIGNDKWVNGIVPARIFSSQE